jgi:hypothetical protein
MKLYIWQPRGFGEMSFSIVAESEEAAREAVNLKISELLEKGQREDYYEDDNIYRPHHFDGWGTEYYQLTVVELGVVVLHDNE